MNSQNIFPTNNEVAVGTFRKLSESAKKHISVERIALLLMHKDNYLMGLTYSQKCKVSDNRIIEVVQVRLQKRAGVILTKALIRLVLQAEEKYFASKYATEDEMLDWAA